MRSVRRPTYRVALGRGMLDGQGPASRGKVPSMRRPTSSPMPSLRLASVLATVVLVVAACGGPPAPRGPVEVELDGIRATITDARRFAGAYACAGGTVVDVQGVAGTTDDVADFLLVRPAREGPDDLIVFAHGYRDPALEAGFWVATPRDLDDVLAALGAGDGADLSAGVAQALELAVCPFDLPTGTSKVPHAFGASSYSENGYALAQGVPESHIVGALFDHYFGAAVRTYATGASLGGLVALQLAETYPARYDGALAACGPVAGGLPQLAYVADVETMFRYLYPGVLPGSVAEPVGLPYGDPAAPGDPDDPGYEPTVVGEIVAAIAQDPTGLADLARVEVDREGVRRGLLQADPSDPSSHLPALLEAMYYAGVGKADILARGAGSPFDNQGASYLLDDVPLPDVARYEASAAAAAYYADHYQPTGDLRIPTVTIHNRHDPIVPAWHESAYAARVATAGRADELLTVIVPLEGVPTGTDPFGHCRFAPEVVAGFAELAAWVETGVRPSLPGALRAGSDPALAAD